MTTPRRGFKKIAPQLIRQAPGRTSEEIARDALEQGLVGSNSRDPVFSLRTTLEKEYREERVPGIVKIDGRFYPADAVPADVQNDSHFEVALGANETKFVRGLVEIERFRTPAEAVAFLTQEGIRIHRQDLERILLEVQDIKARKEAARAILTQTTLDLPLIARGKVRDIYDLGDRLLIVATDRISAFDAVLPTGIPDKGLVLTQLSAFWFERTGDIVPNHFIQVVDSTRIEGVPGELPREIIGRAMVVRKAERIDVECVVRGYLSGSGWRDYQRDGAICGVKLDPGLKESQELFEPIFTPTTKADEGHDLPIPYEDVVALAGDRAANAMRLRSLALYRYGRDYARERGVIIADTKFEFGWRDDEVTLIDECLTPDSSRFWPAEGYRSGGPQPSFDKQYLRDYLEETGWDKSPPAPALPDAVVQRTSEKYREAFQRLTGRELVRP